MTTFDNALEAWLKWKRVGEGLGEGSVHTPGSGYVLLHHVMGETDGDRGIATLHVQNCTEENGVVNYDDKCQKFLLGEQVYLRDDIPCRYVEGGMGSVSLAISKAAKEAGAHVVTSAEVSQLMIEDSGRVNGVLLADGTRVHSSVVLSNATPYKTFMEFVPENVLPDDFLRAIKYSDYSSGTTKMNLAVDTLPQFQCCKLSHPDAGPQHVGTIHIGSESCEFRQGTRIAATNNCRNEA
ncbi:Pyridine nucleotide-disulfide oxidoreductase domain-containing protein 2 [Vitis vinifera]|uniref:Pyridine nucleotide-disulfide oxidoreductase domain-containing protein 2 n=1 Tax=Vitis vinifera TaxID=29760 RepID=A0A438K628_VITVI|nr:Pyridine nucleotide-disulfide oxidoreductase domain-containing protein 2 [Vitis vinifera]